MACGPLDHVARIVRAPSGGSPSHSAARPCWEGARGEGVGRAGRLVAVVDEILVGDDPRRGLSIRLEGREQQLVHHEDHLRSVRPSQG